jgi:Pentapeptide repeats (9 copies)
MNLAMIQLVLASVLGAGALVALAIVSRRRRVARGMPAHDQAEAFSERFNTIITQIGDDQAAVRLAGIYAMAALADDWQANRQACIDVLCAYLRKPYEPDPGGDHDAAEQLEFQGSREARHSAILVIAERLRKGAAVSWQGTDLDFTGVVFDGGDFSGVVFSGGRVNFSRAAFVIDTSRFNLAEFSGGSVSFEGAKFSGGTVYLGGAVFSGGTVHFGSKFTSSAVRLDYAKFSGGTVSFEGAEFSGGTVSFEGAEFSGSAVSFTGASFNGGAVDFSDAADWSVPPTFDWEGAPPSAVILPRADDATPT